jgi:hypothetical protein
MPLDLEPVLDLEPIQDTGKLDLEPIESAAPEPSRSWLGSAGNAYGPSWTPTGVPELVAPIVDAISPSSQQYQDIGGMVAHPFDLARKSEPPGVLATSLAGPHRGLNELAVGTFTDPIAVSALALGTKPVQTAIGVAAPLVSRAITGLFATEMAKATPEIYYNVKDAIQHGTVEDIAKAFTVAGGTGVMIGALVKHLRSPGVVNEFKKTFQEPTKSEIATEAMQNPEQRALVDQAAIDALNPRNAQEVVTSRVPAAVDLQTQRGIRDAADALAGREGTAPETFGRTAAAPAMPTRFPISDAVRAKLEVARKADQTSVEPTPVITPEPVKPIELPKEVIPDVAKQEAVQGKEAVVEPGLVEAKPVTPVESKPIEPAPVVEKQPSKMEGPMTKEHLPIILGTDPVGNTWEYKKPSGVSKRVNVTGLMTEYNQKFAKAIPEYVKTNPRGPSENLIDYKNRIRQSVSVTESDVSLLEKIIEGLRTNSKALTDEIMAEKSTKMRRILNMDKDGVDGYVHNYEQELSRVKSKLPISPARQRSQP